MLIGLVVSVGCDKVRETLPLKWSWLTIISPLLADDCCIYFFDVVKGIIVQVFSDSEDGEVFFVYAEINFAVCFSYVLV